MAEPTLTTPRALLLSIVDEVAREQHLDPAFILRASRIKRAVEARAVVAARLYSRGLSPKRIGTMMKLRQPTVLEFLRKTQRTEKENRHGEQDGTEGSGAAGAT